MTPFKIVDLFLTAKQKILIDYNYKKIHYEMWCCVTKSDKYGGYDTQETYKFDRISYTDKSIILKYKNKVVVELTKNNCVWITCINAVDKYMKVNLVNYDFAAIEDK